MNKASGLRSGASRWRLARAERRLDAAMRAAVEHAGLATDEVRQEALMAQLGALYHARSLAEVEPRALWTTSAPRRAPRLYRVPDEEFHQAAAELTDDSSASGEMFPNTPGSLVAWLGAESEAGLPDEVGVPEDEVHVPAVPDPQQVRAAAEFAEEVRRGEVPSIRTIKRRLQIGQDKAQSVQAYLAGLVESRLVPAEVC